MADKKFVLRIDDKKFAKIEEWAKDEYRSVNGQIEYILSQALRKAGRLKKEPNFEESEESDSSNP